MCNFKQVKFSLGEYQQNMYEKISWKKYSPLLFLEAYLKIFG